MTDIDTALAPTENARTFVGSIFAVDPGTLQSGWVLLDGRQVKHCGVDDNERVRALVASQPVTTWVVIERIEPRYGLNMGWETIGACEWVGRFTEAARGPVALLRRSVILRHLGVAPKGSADAGVRAALLDRWGGPSAARKGMALQHVKTHAWAALAVAVAWQDGAPSSLMRSGVVTAA